MSKPSGKRVRRSPNVPLVRRALHPTPHAHTALSSYRKAVLEVARRLRPNEEEELLFAMKDHVAPEESAEEELTGVDLMECLEKHGLLGPRKFAFLVKYLKNMGRQDLADLFTSPERVGWDSSTLVPYSSQPQASVAMLQAGFAWPFSSFRKLVLEVFRQLTQEEVKDIRWLAQDAFKCLSKPPLGEITGLDLLHAMEDSDILGPGNYSFLVDCLREIGRLDLVELMEPHSMALPHLPESFGFLAQLHQKRMEILSLKKSQYVFGMNSLVATRDGVTKGIRTTAGWFLRICSSLSPKEIDKHSSFVIEELPTTLINTSLYMNSLLDVIEEYRDHGDTAKLCDHIAKCETHLEALQGLMEEVGWEVEPRKRERIATSRQYHPVRRASYGAFSGLAEYTLEWSCDREKVQEEARVLSGKLSRLESILRLCGSMWSLTSWLIAVVQVAVRSPVCLEPYNALFRTLVFRNRQMIANNHGMLEAVLSKTPVGKALLGKFRATKMFSCREESDTTAAMIHASIIPMPVFVFVLLLLSEHPSLAPQDFQVIVSSLKEYVEEQKEVFCLINERVTLMVLDGILSNVELFRQSRMQELGEGCKVLEFL